jgi:hypothetical protein
MESVNLSGDKKKRPNLELLDSVAVTNSRCTVTLLLKLF